MLGSFLTPRLNVDWLSEGSDTTQLTAKLPAILTPQVVAHLPPYFQDINSVEKAEQLLHKMCSEAQVYAISQIDNKSYVGLLFIYGNAGVDAHIGYLFSQQVWGQGLASELLIELINKLNIDSEWTGLLAGVTADNTASIKVLEKAGFVELTQDSEQQGLFYKYQL